MNGYVRGIGLFFPPLFALLLSFLSRFPSLKSGINLKIKLIDPLVRGDSSFLSNESCMRISSSRISLFVIKNWIIKIYIISKIYLSTWQFSFSTHSQKNFHFFHHSTKIKSSNASNDGSNSPKEAKEKKENNRTQFHNFDAIPSICENRLEWNKARFSIRVRYSRGKIATVHGPPPVSSFTPMLRYTMWRWTTATLCCLPAFFPLSEHPRLSFSALGREREREGENSTRNRGRNLRSLVCVGSSIRHVPWIPLIPYSVYEPAKFSKERGNRICRIISREKSSISPPPDFIIVIILLIYIFPACSWYFFILVSLVSSENGNRSSAISKYFFVHIFVISNFESRLILRRVLLILETREIL